MGRVKQHDEELRQRLLLEAGRLLSSEGVTAMTLRRVAALAGTSTTAVYSLFGDKERLLAAMHADGFEALGRALRKAAGAAPLERLAELGLAYRRAALARPHLYGLMFGGLAQGVAVDSAARQAAFAPLVRGVQDCLDSGDLTGVDAQAIATYLWAVSHGWVSLELAGLISGGERRRAADYRDALLRSVVGFLPR